MSPEHTADLERLLAKRQANDADFWATPDGKVGVGEPYSAITALLILHELGVDAEHEAAAGALEALWANWRPEDGRIRVGPSGAIYPCHTANIARVLCRFGYAANERMQATFEHLLENRHEDGGWRCNRGNSGPAPELSNPGVTLFALDALRFRPELVASPEAEAAVETLLAHWESKIPTGPCQFGIGALFMQTEFPFLRYNLFYYVYVLSFYPAARQDPRYREALDALAGKLDEDGLLIIERPHRYLAKWDFCTKGQGSEVATKRWGEIQENLKA